MTSPTYTRRITNKYAGTCACGVRVGEGKGFALLLPSKKWTVTCRPCVTDQEPTPEVANQATRPTFPLTEEQQEAVRLFSEGHSLAIQAGAGTGKTSTLLAIAKSTNRLGQYVAFNKAIVQDAAVKFAGTNCAAATAHALAYRQVGHIYKARLQSGRQSSAEIARRLHIEPFFYTLGDQAKVIQPATLAGYVTKAIRSFCNSAEVEISTRFIEYVDVIDLPTDDGKRTNTNNKALRKHLSRALTVAWQDIIDPDGNLRFNPDHFLKIWELGIHGAPVIPGDYILFDEAQDASPVLLSAVEQQGRQIVFVGDAQQAIYEWRGAVDALETVPADSTCYLTNSFRFGPQITEAANKVLAEIDGAKLRLVGRGAEGVVGRCEAPDAILVRTNAGAISVVLEALADGKQPHLVGGGGEVEAFAKAARKLQRGEPVDHPELGIFQTWAEVQDYAANDPEGTDLALLVKLIDSYGVEAILSAVSNAVSEEDADVVVSTAHKSKGREWDSVRLHSDFPARDDVAELRLLYVAITRARKHLDVESCGQALRVLGRD